MEYPNISWAAAVGEPSRQQRERRGYSRTTWLSAEKSKSLQPGARFELRLWNSSSSWRAPSTISKFATCTIPTSRAAASGYGIRRVPAVVIDGQLVDYIAGFGPNETTLTQAIFD